MNAMVQPFLIADGPWVEIKDGNPTGLAIFKRHYTARPKRKIEQFVGPGFSMVLLTPDARALFVWRKFKSDNDQLGVNCAVFRNEGKTLSSGLIIAADDLAFARWPGERHYTYVHAVRTMARRSRHSSPGACFLHAGWRPCGMTKSGLHILERVPA